MYTEAFKDAMVEKMVVPGGVTASVLSKETGISQPTLSKWKKSRAKVESMAKDRTRRRPQDWTAEERLNAIVETSKMSEEDLGSYLRREGLHSSHLEQWKADFVEVQKAHLTKGGKRKRFVSEEKKKIRELEREIRRKDKALAEATALLILKKKAELIWGLVEDDESA
jgi:transposase-like protein